jgi:hypothetical protein
LPRTNEQLSELRRISYRVQRKNLAFRAQKFNHEKPPRRFLPFFAPEKAFTSSLRKLRSRVGQKYPPNGAISGGGTATKTTTISMAYMVAEVAVMCRPVSGPNSLISGKITGKFAKTGRDGRHLAPSYARQSLTTARIPYAK